jgi:hypothetical protein
MADRDESKNIGRLKPINYPSTGLDISPPEIQKIREAGIAIIRTPQLYPLFGANVEFPSGYTVQYRIGEVEAGKLMDKLLSKLDELGVVKLAEDQTTPESKILNVSSQVERDVELRKAGFKRVVSIVTGTPKEG